MRSAERVIGTEQPLVLVHDPGETETVRRELLPLLGAHRVRTVFERAEAPPEIEEGSVVLTYLGDERLARFLSRAPGRTWTLGFLPHPDMVLARRHYGVAALLEDAVSDVLEAERARPLDLLTCNGTPVFSTVVLGDPSPVAEERESGAAPSGLPRWLRRLRAARSVTLRRLALTTEGNNRLDTAALGLIALEDPRSSILARGLIDEAHPEDGMLHALVLAPRSLTEIAGAWLRSLLHRGKVRARPAFIGHVRTEALAVLAPGETSFTRDGVADSAGEIKLRVAPRALEVLPGRHLESRERSRATKEVFRVHGLPVGEARDLLVDRPVPLRRHAATEEFRELFQLLRENARPSASFLTLMVLSSLLATLGLFAGSGPVIIGAMILAPLMAPIIALAMGVLRQEESFLAQSLKTIGLGGALALGSAAALTSMTPLHTINAEIAARLHPTLLDLGIAAISGVAGAYAHARAHIARSLAGVAIAVALVPPLAVSGIGLGWWDWPVFSGAFLLFLTNLSGMILAAALTFLVLGFSPLRRARRGLLFSLLVALVISVPLANAFHAMVDEHRFIRSLDGWTVEGITLTEVSVRTGDPLHVKATLLSSHPVAASELEAVRAAIEERLERPVILEAVIAVVLEEAPEPAATPSQP